MSLLDIIPQPETAILHGKEIEIRGLTVEDIVSLVARFPALKGVLSGQEITAEKLTSFGGSVVAAIIAAGVGHAGDKDYEAGAARLPIGDAAELLAPIIKATMPSGIGPFVSAVSALGLNAGAATGSPAGAQKI